MLSYIQSAEEQIDKAIAEAGDSPGTLELLQRAKSALMIVRWTRCEIPLASPDEIKLRIMQTLDLMAQERRDLLDAINPEGGN